MKLSKQYAVRVAVAQSKSGANKAERHKTLLKQGMLENHDEVSQRHRPGSFYTERIDRSLEN